MNLRKINLYAVVLCFIITTSACSSKQLAPNTLTEQEKKEGWKLLFDGHSFANWHLYNSEQKTAAWEILDGTLYCNPKSEAPKFDLTTDKVYENYELTFEWKLEKEGNSGVFVNVQERPDILSTYHSGPEYQLLEDSHADFNIPLKKPGVLYTFLPQQNFVNTKKLGEWNNSKIIQKNGFIKFYLNGQQTAEMDFKSKQWKSLVSNSKFKEFADFGQHTKGKIALQDWSRGCSFRSIKIKEL
ncbi:DUF1080 domain-containing protein [Sphingobacteriaceae bacterium WQ 2009]|uniref:DUF1080 domain-containing protein n=1 Tax=Rhinopithecimicrobium faecis TaxID=2820698 RepID=A0A8T4HI33_9SPHI|nr:DUF1080 domain-containing protein [Sphingobacteriaceae bacterium WQ 2009]